MTRSNFKIGDTVVATRLLADTYAQHDNPEISLTNRFGGVLRILSIKGDSAKVKNSKGLHNYIHTDWLDYFNGPFSSKFEEFYDDEYIK